MAPQEPKSRKPANTAFKQQRLKAWQPILTPKTVLPTFFIVGVLFAPLGGLLLYASDGVSEISIDYTGCNKAPTEPDNMPSNLIKTSFARTNSTPVEQPMWSRIDNVDLKLDNNYTVPATKCVIQFTLPFQLEPPVYFYYRLTNFFQNHRRYVKSFDAKQLKGDAVSLDALSKGNCKPLAESDGIIYFPCGLIANSQFNDTITNFTLLNPGDTNVSSTTYSFSEKDIAWPSDKQKYGKTSYIDFTKIQPPPNWQSRYPDGRYSDAYPPPNLREDEHFQVWMRTAGLPDFRKLYGQNKKDPMVEGRYSVEIYTLFPVEKYGGTKSLVISTVSFLGGKNPFLGIAYITVGIVCVVFGCLFTARHLYKPRKLGDHTYLSWNKNSNHAGSSTDTHRD